MATILAAVDLSTLQAAVTSNGVIIVLVALAFAALRLAKRVLRNV